MINLRKHFEMTSRGHSTALHYSARSGNKMIVERLLNRGVHVNAEGDSDETPLYDAIKSGHTKIVQELLNRGAFVNVKNSLGITPLYLAVQRGNNEKIVELLLSRGAEVDAQGPSGMTALHKAALNGYLRISKRLLKRGASVSSVCTYNFAGGYTPLHLAAENGRAEIVKLLLNSNAVIDPYTEDRLTPLYIATSRGRTRVVKLLLEHWADVNAHSENGNTSLHVAAGRCNVKIVKLLLNSNAYVDACTKYDYITPLYVATALGHEEVVKLLIERKANVDVQAEDGKAIIHLAAEKGNVGIIKLLLNNNARVDPCNKDNLTPVFFATQMGHAEVVELLLEHKANVDAHDNYGQTILNLAVKNGDLPVIEHILHYYPDVNNDSNRGALDTAIHHGGSDENWRTIIEKLLEHGFSVASISDVGDINYCRLLLYEAADKGYLRIVEDILKLGIDINTIHILQSENNQTLLHNATKNRWEKLAKLLISYGADVNVKDEAGKTSIYYAIKATVEGIQRSEVTRLLMSYQVNMNAKVKSRNTPMFEVTKSTNFEMFELLLTNGANLKDPKLLNMAVKLECIDLAAILLEHDIDINSNTCDKYGRTALHFTATSRKTELNNQDILLGYPDRDEKMADIARMLLSKGADVDARSANGSTALHDACSIGHGKVVETILHYSNADVNSPTSNGNTPLHLSAHAGNETIIRVLVTSGADINAQGKDGNTPLAIATNQGHIRIVELLLNCGVEVDSKYSNGVTPLHLAAEKGHLDILQLLLKYGADIDSKDELSRTALYIAVRANNEKILRTVLEYGSDVNVTSGDFCTPLNIAVASVKFYELVYNCHHFYGNPNRENSTWRKIIRILQQHFIKMMSANLYVSEENLDSLPNINNGSAYFRYQCEREVEAMKSEKIGDSNVSLYSILTKNVSQLAVCARNDSIAEIIISEEYEAKFPIYGKMITGYIRKGVKRRYLLEECITLFNDLFNYLPELPYIAVENIFSYLNNEDLKVVINNLWPSKTSLEEEAIVLVV